MASDPKMVALVLGKMKAAKPGAPAGPGDGYQAAAEEILSAVKSGDASGLASALKSFVGMCGDEPDEGA